MVNLIYWPTETIKEALEQEKERIIIAHGFIKMAENELKRREKEFDNK